MRRKKDIPYVILEKLKPFINLQDELFLVDLQNKNFLLQLFDKEKDSGFHFFIKDYRNAQTGFNLLISIHPYSASSNKAQESWIEIKQLESWFTRWTDLLQKYNNIESFYDDPVLKKFEEEYYSEFEILDEDSEIDPFSTSQILLLDEILIKIDNELNNRITEENKDTIEEIKSEIKNVQENLTQKSKKWIIQRIAKIYAAISKQGISFIKDFANESKKTIIKEIITGSKHLIQTGIDSIT